MMADLLRVSINIQIPRLRTIVTFTILALVAGFPAVSPDMNLYLSKFIPAL
jgi:hypothetical protein